jgi:hypothetical protein
MKHFNNLTMAEIKKRQQEEIEEFQDSCPHASISNWIPYMWAPGHFGNHVKICERCNKIMEEDIPLCSVHVWPRNI